MSKKGLKIENIFHKDVGQVINHVERMEVSFGKDAQMAEQQAEEVKAKTEEEAAAKGAEVPMLPAELDTEEGRRLLEEAQEMGWLDKEFQPSGLLKVQCALLGGVLGDRIGIVKKWSVFEKFWHVGGLAQSFQQGLDSGAQANFYNLLTKVIR